MKVTEWEMWWLCCVNQRTSCSTLHILGPKSIPGTQQQHQKLNDYHTLSSISSVWSSLWVHILSETFFFFTLFPCFFCTISSVRMPDVRRIVMNIHSDPTVLLGENLFFLLFLHMLLCYLYRLKKKVNHTRFLPLYSSSHAAVALYAEQRDVFLTCGSL